MKNIKPIFPHVFACLPRMIMPKTLIFIGIVCIALAGMRTSFAQDRDHPEDRQQLLDLMNKVEAGINAQDIEHLTALMTEDVTVIWLNAVVSRGKREVKAYYANMVGSDSAVLKKYTTKVTLSAPARFDNDLALADGKAADEFFPHSRSSFQLDSRWSATLRKVDNQWKIAQLHLSTNVFTNPLMAEAERWIWQAGIIGLAVGSLFMMLILLIRYRKAR